ncbi:patatin-like phospholipase family protein [Nocardia sp. NBC_01503]|uniref:patatin-like phospholipase family protein n=1 Tax=Nocardia sp. NBC_01503 TaxID=2975997 RepID=UPI002E7BD0EF|nr:patatin-like phospholipase family protein [Nocardia sp. NBC_01503]WTL32052.1 patatin-like phospholipase family protein [Nocardia sp. NBC_01503]
MSNTTTGPVPHTAFVLGGGGMLGGYQVGMLRALAEYGITPDLVIGTSVGSIQGAILAAPRTGNTIDALTAFWHDALTEKVMGVPVRSLLTNLVRLRPALATQDALREVLERHVGVDTRIEQLGIPFQCAAASIERATARYFDYGPVIPALLASSCIPGLWPPLRIGAEHYIDGGVVETVPFTRAVSFGAKEIYVLRLRQRELPLKSPRLPWQLGQTVFEVSRRHRLGQVINMRPAGVTVHLLPTGEDLLEPPDTGLYTTVQQQLEIFERRVTAGYRSTVDYLSATEERKTAIIRSRTREPKRIPVHRNHSEFVRDKLARFFDLFDHDGDQRVSSAEYTAAADRICVAFACPPESATGTRLHTAIAEFWAGLCREAGTDPRGQLNRDQYVDALARLTTNPADYDKHVLPAIAAILAAADHDRDAVLNVDELHHLLTALGVDTSGIHAVSLRLDTNNDGVLSLDELDEAFADYFTSEEPGAPGNLLFGA